MPAIRAIVSLSPAACPARKRARLLIYLVNIKHFAGFLALPLLMGRIRANHAHDTLAAHDFAIPAHFLD
jgi:hypothetical protein